MRRQVGAGHEWVNRGKTTCKFNFEVEVEVEGMEVRLDPEEHQAFFWATERECRKAIVVREGKRTEIKWTRDSQLVPILEGFRLRREEGN